MHARLQEVVSSARPGRPERRKTRKIVTRAPSQLSWLMNLKNVRTESKYSHFQATFEQKKLPGKNSRTILMDFDGLVFSGPGA